MRLPVVLGLSLTIAGALTVAPAGQAAAPFRPPAVPLVAHDPYFSIWSFADKLSDDNTVHWTGKPNTLAALARIDGTTYELTGGGRRRGGAAPVLEQTGLEVLPTRTIYTLRGGGIQITLTFFTPALPGDLDVLSRPLTYLQWTAESADGRAHAVSVYCEAGSDLVINTPDQPVTATRLQVDGQPALRMGSRAQDMLGRRGDDVRIDWGYLYMAADRGDNVTAAIATPQETRKAFTAGEPLPSTDDPPPDDAVAGRQRASVLAFRVDLGQVTQPVTRYLMLAYDDVYSVEYMGRRERAWWRRHGATVVDLLRDGRKDHDALLARAEAFDTGLVADLVAEGGEEYARLAALAYRQTLAAHKLVADADGDPLYFPKENFSNGCISTVDVIYPSAPFTLLFNPTLLEAQLRPVLEYAAMPRWPWPFAPHDLGTYPLADGQVYGGGERTETNQMPVEESGNMLILLGALAKIEGNATFANRYWPQVTKWAEYLKAKGLDPENQLSTDDFAGHLAHNANLSIKAILALGSYGLLADMTGRKDVAASYRATAADFAAKWQSMARDGDHYKLAFDHAGTWSQKYNLVWDRILGLHLFPPDVARTELAFYKTKVNPYGLPLDNRKDYTKLDWEIWTATLSDSKAQFEELVAPVYRFANESPSRVPLTDWYDTVTAKQEGFQARSVVGGVFVRMLADPGMWRKYAGAPGTGAP